MNLLNVLTFLSLTWCVCGIFQSRNPSSFKERLLRAKSLLEEVPLIDGHNDVAFNIRETVENQLELFPFERNLSREEPWASREYTHTDLDKLRLGRVGAQFWAAWVDCKSQYKNAVVHGIEQIDVIKRLIKKYPNDLELALTAQDILDAFGRGRIGSLIGVEGGHMIDSSAAVLRTFYEIGARYLTLTHNCDTPWAEQSGSEKEPTSNFKGLTQWGKSLIVEMNRLGMMVDISHVSSDTMVDVINTSKAPVIFSHSSARALCSHARNVPDHVLKMVHEKNDGLVMVNFYNTFVTCSDDASLHDVIDHINHMRKVAGIDNVGLGADYDGVKLVPEGLENASTFPNLIAELMLDPTWSRDDLKKFLGGNLLRVMSKVEQVKESLKNMKPFDQPIPLKDIEGHTECKNIWPDPSSGAAGTGRGQITLTTFLFGLIILYILL